MKTKLDGNPMVQPMSSLLRVVGFDPSLRNWGWSSGIYNMDTGNITVHEVGVLQPVLSTGKQVRQNSLDLESAFQLYQGTQNVAINAQAIFIEVPVGSQSARAMASYGICVGVLGALRANKIPFFEVTPTEVKMASVGSKTATKEQMIDWALQHHANANWPTYRDNGVVKVSSAKAEHMVDATAAIHAGIKLPAFQQLLQMRIAA